MGTDSTGPAKAVRRLRTALSILRVTVKGLTVVGGALLWFIVAYLPYEMGMAGRLGEWRVWLGIGVFSLFAVAGSIAMRAAWREVDEWPVD